MKIPVPETLPKGTPINLVIEVNALSDITIRGNIKDKSGSLPFEGTLEMPPERTIPTEEEIQALDQAFQQVLVTLPPEQQARVEEHYQKARASYEIALKREDTDNVVNDFEEMEELIASNINEEGPLQPPKDFFDKLVKECQDLVNLLTKVGQIPKVQELVQAIDMQQQQGEQAFAISDHMSYADAIVKLNAIRDHLVMVLRQVIDIEDPRTDQERASDGIKFALEEAEDVSLLAITEQRKDLQNEIVLIKSLLRTSSQDIQRDPQAVIQKTQQARTRLERIKNVLMGTLGQSREGKLVEE